MSLPSVVFSEVFNVFLFLCVFSAVAIDYNLYDHGHQPNTGHADVLTTRDLLQKTSDAVSSQPIYGLQEGAERLLQYATLLRIRVLDTLGSLLYDRYDDLSITEVESLYRIYLETLERKSNIFDLISVVLRNPDVRTSEICDHFYHRLNSCLKECSDICDAIKRYDRPFHDSLETTLNVAGRYINSSDVLEKIYRKGFSLPILLRFLRKGTLNLTSSLLSGIILNVPYDSVDDDVRYYEREVCRFIAAEGKILDESPLSTEEIKNIPTMADLLKYYLKTRADRFTERARRSAEFLTRHVVNDVDSLDENIHLLWNVYENDTVHLKYLFNLVLPADLLDEDVLQARDYLVKKIEGLNDFREWVRIDKYQLVSPEQLVMQIARRLKDIDFEVDVNTALRAHARFWHKSRMVVDLEDLLELFDAYENLRGVTEYKNLMSMIDEIKEGLKNSRNVSVEILCHAPRPCLRTGLETVFRCPYVNSQVKRSIEKFFKLVDSRGALVQEQCPLPMDRSPTVLKIGTESTEFVTSPIVNTAKTRRVQTTAETLSGKTEREKVSTEGGILEDESDLAGELGKESFSESVSPEEFVEITTSIPRISAAKVETESLIVETTTDAAKESVRSTETTANEISTTESMSSTVTTETVPMVSTLMQTIPEASTTLSTAKEKLRESTVTVPAESTMATEIQEECSGEDCMEMECSDENCSSETLERDEVESIENRTVGCPKIKCQQSYEDEESCEGSECESMESETEVSCQGSDCSDSEEDSRLIESLLMTTAEPDDGKNRTGCEKTDPHHRRKMNRLRKMRRLSALRTAKLIREQQLARKESWQTDKAGVSKKALQNLMLGRSKLDFEDFNDVLGGAKKGKFGGDEIHAAMKTEKSEDSSNNDYSVIPENRRHRGNKLHVLLKTRRSEDSDNDSFVIPENRRHRGNKLHVLLKTRRSEDSDDSSVIPENRRHRGNKLHVLLKTRRSEDSDNDSSVIPENRRHRGNKFHVLMKTRRSEDSGGFPEEMGDGKMSGDKFLAKTATRGSENFDNLPEDLNDPKLNANKLRTMMKTRRYKHDFTRKGKLRVPLKTRRYNYAREGKLQVRYVNRNRRSKYHSAANHRRMKHRLLSTKVKSGKRIRERIPATDPSQTDGTLKRNPQSIVIRSPRKAVMVTHRL